ncbi:uncharacterized protein LOC122500547 [Leptopilina heterotoma]|uniref:uncharacterized protein LOC122500547 n=1 Tax=Leptopilina heterotoma TaxID=63436 RepID=UPI001CA7F5B7|nr:uncharacterized protein LOC122500547 [Leptopilina heterotoma]
MKLSISTLLLILSILINNSQSNSYNFPPYSYKTREAAEIHCVYPHSIIKKHPIFKTKKTVLVYICKGGDLDSYYKIKDEAKESCVSKYDHLYYCKYDKESYQNSLESLNLPD